jgi:hypothetical protein
VARKGDSASAEVKVIVTAEGTAEATLTMPDDK